MPDTTDRAADDAPDPLAGRLAYLRSRHYRIPDPSIVNAAAGICASDRHKWPCHAHLALAAVEAVLKAHRPSTADGRCNWCRDPDGQRSVFPCGEYLTIRAALTGKEADRG